MTIQITIIIVAISAAVIYVTATIRHMSDQSAAGSARSDYLALLAEKERRQAEADRETRAANFYGLQMALTTVQAQAQAQAAVNLETVQTLKTAIESMTESREVVDALATLETRAIVGAYTKYLNDKEAEKNKGSKPQRITARYWEEVAPDAYI